MAYQLAQVVPWGRTLAEYRRMFALSDEDCTKSIVSFGDGPASFNAEMNNQGNSVCSLDIIYRYTKEEIAQRIAETKEIIAQQVNDNLHQFNWNEIKNPQELLDLRLSAMKMFLDDYTIGSERYLVHECPNRTIFKDNEFELALSSHFLFLYSDLGVDFHKQIIAEMLRISKEVRIFPIINLQSEYSEVYHKIFEYFKKKCEVEIVEVDYEFQKGADKMMVLK